MAKKQDYKEQALPDIVVEVREKFFNAQASKQELHAIWKDCYDAYTGKLFERNSKNKHLGDAIPNHIFSTLETVKPIMVTNPPQSIVYPTQADGYAKAMMIQQALEYEWTRTRLLSKLHDSLTNMLVYGTTIFGLFWDGQAKKGQGEIVPKVISPFNFFIDPMAEEIQDADFCGYATYKSLGELIKEYPDKKEELMANARSEMDEELTMGKDTNTTKNQVLYIECYLKDHSLDERIEQEGDKKYKVKSKKYPNGRRVILGGEVLLKDGANPYEGGKFPFVAQQNYKIPGKFWGMSEVEPLLSVQKEICSLYNALIDNAKLNGNPWTIMDKNSGIDVKTLSNSPGLVLKKNPGSEIKRDAPPPLPAYIKETISDLKYDVQVISGVYDATRGERPMSITSGVAIQALQDSSQGRIRLKIQSMEVMLSELGSMWLQRMQQFWKLKRTIRIMGGQYQPDMMPIMIDGQPVTFREIGKDDIDGDFDVSIKTGSSMPVNKSARLETIMRLAQTPAEDGMPILDRRTIIEYCDLDNAEDILRRFDEQAQKNQEAQQQQMEQEMAMKEQEAQQQMAMMQQNQQLNQQSQMEALQMQNEGKLALEQEKGKVQMALQDKEHMLEKDIKNLDLDNMTVEELLQYLQTLDEKQLQALVQNQPEIMQVLEILNQMNNPQDGTQGGDE